MCSNILINKFSDPGNSGKYDKQIRQSNQPTDEPLKESYTSNSRILACVYVGKISNRAKGLYRYNPNPPVHPGVLLVLGLGRGARTRARDEPHLRVR